MKLALRLFILLVLLCSGTIALMMHVARADPVVRRATIELPRWPAGAASVTIALLSDIHIGNRAMDQARLARIVAQINALHPDIVLMAGDFLAGHDPATGKRFSAMLTPPLSRLTPRLGSYAVLGNHDHWIDADATRRALAAAHVTVLDNNARTVGPIALGGVGDNFTHHDKVAATLAAQRRLPGAPLLLSHSPDILPQLRRGILLAGHSHCGQVVLPLIGPLDVPSNYGTRYLCGVIREGARSAIVTAGLGTSVVPLRFGAPPDIWLLTARPSPRR